jgi:hypothetical protein
MTSSAGAEIDEVPSHSPHRYIATLEDHPLWDAEAEVLRVWAGDSVVEYRRDELIDNIRYI